MRAAISALILVSLAGAVLGAPSAQGGSPAPAPATVAYSVKTPWSIFRIQRVDRSGGFEAWVSSDVPLDGWILTQKGAAKPLGRQSLNASYDFHFSIPQPFSDDLKLTVFPLVDGSPQPLAVPWSAGVSNESTPTMGGGLDLEMTWKEDSSRPYNRVVQGLFRSALKDYRADRIDEAMKSLDQALTLDPTHPQVLELRERILEGSGTPNRKADLREAEAQLRAGNPALALEKTEALLAADPKDPEALALKSKIEAALNGAEAKPQKRPGRRKKATPAPQEDPDSKARADEAYNLGLESYRKGNWAGAKSFWQQALQNDPHHLQSRRALDRLQAEQPGMK